MQISTKVCRSGLRWTMPMVACAIGLTASPTVAQSSDDENRVDVTAAVELRTIRSDLDFDQGEDFDSTGIGARADAAVTYHVDDKTRLRASARASIFDYEDGGRDTLESIGGSLSVSRDLSETVELRLHARRVENIAVLEALSADQTTFGTRLQWQDGDNRVRLYADYREREYDTTIPGDGEGWRLAAQYNYRIDSYHWLRFDLRAEDMESDNAPRRSYDRRIARIKYSLPIAKRLRLRPSIEYREWDYDARTAQGDPNRELRRDSYFAPGVDLAWGRASRGFYAVAAAEYRFRSSNDIRFDNNAFRGSLRVGYRF